MSVKDIAIKPQKDGVQKASRETSLVVQWLRICLAVQGTPVQSLVQEDPNALGQRSPCATTTEAHAPRIHALQQEKPLKQEAHAPQLEKGPHAATKTQRSQK